MSAAIQQGEPQIACDLPESSPERKRVPDVLGLAAGLLVSGLALRDGLYEAPRPYHAVGAAALGILLLSRVVWANRRAAPRRLTLALAVAAFAAIWLASVDRVLLTWEPRVRPGGAVAAAVAPLLSAMGHPAAAGRDALQVIHSDGLVEVVPSPEKLGLRPHLELWLVWIALHAVLDGRRVTRLAAWGVGVVALGVLARFTLCLSAYLEHDNVLVGEAGFDALSVFSSPFVTVGSLVVCGAALGLVRWRVLSVAPEVRVPSPPARSVARGLVAALACGGAAGFAATADPPGRQKPGRVLIDDRFGGVWEPTARLLDTQWYGDFSTYSFNSLAEWLGHWYSVDVNPTRGYTDEFLAGYDVLVVKTPVQPIPPSEREAIDRFVNAGGGLLLVGDHTNLLGMGTHLNALCDRYGLRFCYDSVSDARTGGFVDCDGPAVGRSASALHVDRLQFMTGCSLAVDSRAEPVLVAPSCRRDPHDYAASSFFGRFGPHPELAHGPVVVAATVRVGKGRVTAFTDSTVWSSFATFQFDREKLAADMVGVLNREASPLRRPLRVASVGAIALALVLCAGGVRSGGALPICFGSLVGVWGGVIAADAYHRSVYEMGPPRAPVREVSFLWAGGRCAFPPVLGSTGDLPLDVAYDTLFTSVQRVGLTPRVARTFDRDLLTDSTQALVVIAPVDRPPPAALARIEAFVRSGGALVVIDDGRLGGGGSAADYLRVFGVEVSYDRRAGRTGESIVHSNLNGLTALGGVPAPETFVGHRAFGAGHVIYMRDAADYSRVGLGHCFNRPGREARARYETVFWLFRDVLRLMPPDRKFYGICD